MEAIQSKQQIDLKEAENNMSEFLKLQTQKAAIDTAMKAYKESLKEFADRNKNLIDDDGKIQLGVGFIHIGKETSVVCPKKFSIVNFIKKFPTLIKWEFRVAAVKPYFDNDKDRAKMKAFKVRLVEEPTFKIVAAKPSTENKQQPQLQNGEAN